MLPTVQQHLCNQDNDYSLLEVEYYRQAGGQLVSDPYASVFHSPPDITLTASVIIPAWNAASSIQHCLLAIEQSSFNQKYPQQLEVVVVDDGSQDETWQILENTHLNLHLKVIRQDNGGRSCARNTAISMSEGDVIICCDADMVLTLFSIEELMKRHQVLEKVLLIGFRSLLPSAYPFLQPTIFSDSLKKILPVFFADLRVHSLIDGRGFCRETNHLKHCGRGKHIISSAGICYNLPDYVLGCLFSLRRDDFLDMGGFDEDFHGWGCEDSMVGAQAIARGNYIIPVYSATGLHIEHEVRYPHLSISHNENHKWQEYTTNYMHYYKKRHEQLQHSDTTWITHARERIQKYIEHYSLVKHTNRALDTSYYDYYNTALHNLYHAGWYYFHLGRYEEAARAFSFVQGNEKVQLQAALMHGRALRMSGQVDESVTVLKNSLSCSVDGNLSAHARIELAFSLATQGCFVEARQQFQHAHDLQPRHPLIHYLTNKSVDEQCMRAALYLRQGDYALALQNYEAALMLDPHNLPIQMSRAKTLAASGQTEASNKALDSYIQSCNLDHHPNNFSLLARVWEHFAQGQTQLSKLALEQIGRLHPENTVIAHNLDQLDKVAVQSQLPLSANSIIRDIQALPGGLDQNELAFLITLTTWTINKQRVNEGLRFIDMNSFCGQATVAMSLTARGMNAHNISLLSIAQPCEEPVLLDSATPHASRDLFYQNLWKYELTEQVICIPEQREISHVESCHLLLFDNACNKAKLPQDYERYHPLLLPGSLLIAHPYSDMCPDIQRWINTLLINSHYTVFDQVGDMIAIQCLFS